MTPRARVLTLTAAAAVLVVGAVIGVTLLQTHGETTAAPGATSKPRAGVPPLLFDFGVRNDAEARDLARGAQLLAKGKRAAAAALFERHDSLQAQIGRAFARWPDGGLDELKRLAGTHPDSPVAQLHLGLALYWSGRNADAVHTFEQVDERFPDSPSAVDAENVLYAGRFFPGLPYMVAPVELPDAPTLAGQLDRAKLLARQPGIRGKVVLGVMFWRLDRRISARRQLDGAAARAPNDPVVLTLDAVAHFTKRDPAAAFARLGPLSGRFPKAAVVRFHLGLLLLWQRELPKAATQLRLAVAAEPRSTYAVQAKRLLSAIPAGGTK